VPVELGEALAELVDRAAIELARRHDIVAGAHQGVQRQQLRRMAAAQDRPARPPSSAATRSSSTALVGFMMRE
jgi:hypothetical protein